MKTISNKNDQELNYVNYLSINSQGFIAGSLCELEDHEGLTEDQLQQTVDLVAQILDKLVTAAIADNIEEDEEETSKPSGAEGVSAVLKKIDLNCEWCEDAEKCSFYRDCQEIIKKNESVGEWNKIVRDRDCGTLSAEQYDEAIKKHHKKVLLDSLIPAYIYKHHLKAIHHFIIDICMNGDVDADAAEIIRRCEKWCILHYDEQPISPLSSFLHYHDDVIVKMLRG